MKLTELQLLRLKIRSNQEILLLKRKFGMSKFEHSTKCKEIDTAVKYLEKRNNLDLDTFLKGDFG